MTNDPPHRESEELSTTTNSNVYWKLRRQFVLGCSICPPHRYENHSRKPKSDTHKNKRRS